MINKRIFNPKEQEPNHGLTMNQMGSAVNALFGKPKENEFVKNILEKRKEYEKSIAKNS